MLDELREVVCEFVDIDAGVINEGTNIRQTLKLNSLETINLIVAIEDAFDVQIDDDEIADIETVSDILKLIELKRS